MLLEVLALTGYGLWMLLGLALALGIYSTGRGDVLVPLALGLVFVSAGLVAACLRLPVFRVWHGWRIGRSQRPSREALLALATYLPMFALAGMARGNDSFWATRLVSVVLMICSLACLIASAYGYRARRLFKRSHVASQLPISRVLSAWYGGGLWLWVCIIYQANLSGDAVESWPLAIGLLMLAMLLGLVEGMGWRALQAAELAESPPEPNLQLWRFVAALLVCAVPCICLLIVPRWPDGRWLALLAACAYLAGKSIEMWLYDIALSRTIAKSESA